MLVGTLLCRRRRCHILLGTLRKDRRNAAESLRTQRHRRRRQPGHRPGLRPGFSRGGMPRRSDRTRPDSPGGGPHGPGRRRRSSHDPSRRSRRPGGRGGRSRRSGRALRTRGHPGELGRRGRTLQSRRTVAGRLSAGNGREVLHVHQRHGCGRQGHGRPRTRRHRQHNRLREARPHPSRTSPAERPTPH